MTIVIPAFIQQAIIAASQERLPREMCGLLFGHGYEAERFVQIQNVADHADDYFQMDPKEMISAISTHSQEMALIGIVHSHPTRDAYPSESDIKWASDLVYVIHGTDGLHAFTIHEGSAHEVEVLNDQVSHR